MTPTATLVKICGLTRPDDALAAARAGADLLGMVFAPGSKRRVDAGKARGIVAFVRGWFEQTNARRAQTPQCGTEDSLSCPKFVGVFVDESGERMNEIATEAGLDYIQLHGDEDPGIVAKLVRPVVRAIRVETSWPDISCWSSADWILFDAAAGGSGVSFDWQLLKGVDKPFLLAGGLSPDNVVEAIKLTGAAGVDVSSGVEVTPGVKDHDKIRRFVRAAKGVDAPSPPGPSPRRGEGRAARKDVEDHTEN